MKNQSEQRYRSGKSVWYEECQEIQCGRRVGPQEQTNLQSEARAGRWRFYKTRCPVVAVGNDQR